MNLVQVCTQEEKDHLFEGDISISVFCYYVGMMLYQFCIPDIEFVPCKGGYSFAYLYRSLCRCHEWALIGTRYSLNGEKIVPFSIEHAPGYGFGDVSGTVLLSNGKTILQNEIAKNKLIKQMEDTNFAKDAKLEHGIRAGLWLFDSFATQYLDIYEKRRKEKSISFLKFETKEEYGLTFCYEQWNVYAYLSYCLFVHERIEEYICKIGKRIAIDEDPILFLLVFCEKIFPKSFYKTNMHLEKELLKKIRLDIKDCKFIIEVCDKKLQIKELLEGIYELEHILQIKSSYDPKTSRVVIQILKNAG